MGSEAFLLYVSQAPGSDRGVSSKEALRNKVLTHPTVGGVTGVLIYRNGYFMQYLEGHELSVLSLFSKIRANINHYNVRVLSQGQLVRRRFLDWTIKVVFLNGPCPSSESLIELFETVLVIKSNSESEIDAVINRFCKDSVVLSKNHESFHIDKSL